MKEPSNIINKLFLLSLFASVLALIVVVLGAYTRLGDAGLGCPDWPGCYGYITVPNTQPEIIAASIQFPEATIEPAKAWKEMIHRYVAGTLGILIFVIVAYAVRARKFLGKSFIVPLVLIPLVLFQAVLGMWTVTMKLLPLVVMGHLLGGLTILSCLWWLVLKTAPNDHKLLRNYKPEITDKQAIWYAWAMIALVVCVFQIALGGWTSANYAALACPDFPFCHGKLFPAVDIAKAFNFFSPVGANYEGGLLDSIARATINTFHRFGGLITGVVIGSLGVTLMLAARWRHIRFLCFILTALLALQIGFGILNITELLPLPVAVAHNGIAALLLCGLLSVIYYLKFIPSELPNDK